MEPVIGTVSGGRVNYFNPLPETIRIEDIAVGLSHVCRFAGQVERHYSVGQHSMAVAKKVLAATGDKRQALQGLLHDASEAYTGDIPTPLKHAVGAAIMDIENRLQRCIYDVHSLPHELFPAVHEADKRWLVTERDQLQPRHFDWGSEFAEPYFDVIRLLSAKEVQEEFLYLYHYLTEVSGLAK